MNKQRSSIRGKGAEILFGAPPAVEIKPRAPDPTPAQPRSVEPEAPHPEPAAEEQTDAAHDVLPEQVLEPEPLFDEADLEAALYEEALAGEPSPEGEVEDLSETDADPRPTPEMEAALLEEALGASEPPEPVEELPIPPLEVTMEEQNLIEEAALQAPPPPETSDILSGVLPPRRGYSSLDLEAMEPLTADIQTPEEKVEPLELPERELTDKQRDDMLAWFGHMAIRELTDEIDETYDQVVSKVGGNEGIATWCFNLLLKARDIILRRDVAMLPQAEYYVEQVRTRLQRAAESNAAARKYGWLITGWGFLWGLVYLLVLLLFSLGLFDRLLSLASARQTAVDPEIFLPAMVWGGIGGVVAVWYSLFKHVSQRDFDIQYNLSYVGKPFFGLILGGTVYMVVQLLILTLGIWPAGLPEEIGGLGSPTIAPWIIYLLAWVCGFKENRIFALVDRVVKRTFSGQGTAPGG